MGKDLPKWPCPGFLADHWDGLRGLFLIGNPDLSRANAWFLVEIFPSTNLLIITDRSPDVS